ncbi:gliding motility-associated C-terminal domain-containing protein [Lacinutrix himadriensis]|uniref:gliding motility-associated C-terminal domain-containing protein n=1 Tax=Lacinutrix himadriensis TaxID=641549 RepID=UPI0006E45B21|nr:gliding motility-associated C-terminal domain-containing protein [Lacinutrix himadriensis]
MKKHTNQIIVLLFLIFNNTLYSQNIVDDCFNTVTSVASGDFNSSSDLANIFSSDVIEWDGNNWIGGYPATNITIPPPSNQISCRAIFLGNGTTWTAGGESVGLRLDGPLVEGTTYTFDITYISHGFGSNGVFEPSFYTNSSATLSSATLVGTLMPVGFVWETNSFSFVASSSQDGDTWVILKTESSGTSGLINSFCQNCNINVPNCNVSVNSETICEGSSATIAASLSTPGNYTFQWTVPTGLPNPGNVSSFSTDIDGIYSVIVTNVDTNCNANASGAVSVNPIPIVSVNSESICEGSSATIAASLSTPGNYTFQWTVPTGLPNPGNVSSFSTDIDGIYSVIVTNVDTNCSSNNASGMLDYFSDFDFTIEQYCDQNDFILEVVPINNSFSIQDSSFIWQLNNSNIIESDYMISLSSYLNFTSEIEELPLNISVSVTTNNNCTKTDSLLIEQVFCSIPQGISPNDNGKNDFFDLSLLGIKKLEIFNRWGTSVYQKNNYTNEWHGQSNSGNKLPTSTYFYIVEFKNNSKPISGWVYLNR